MHINELHGRRVMGMEFMLMLTYHLMVFLDTIIAGPIIYTASHWVFLYQWNIISFFHIDFIDFIINTKLFTTFSD